MSVFLLFTSTSAKATLRCENFWEVYLRLRQSDLNLKSRRRPPKKVEKQQRTYKQTWEQGRLGWDMMRLPVWCIADFLIHCYFLISYYGTLRCSHLCNKEQCQNTNFEKVENLYYCTGLSADNLFPIFDQVDDLYYVYRIISWLCVPEYQLMRLVTCIMCTGLSTDQVDNPYYGYQIISWSGWWHI